MCYTQCSVFLIAQRPQRVGIFYSFFFQAEDGIRDPLVTGVQTCALPILIVDKQWISQLSLWVGVMLRSRRSCTLLLTQNILPCRSEERRVGKECRSRRWRVAYN